MEKSCDSFWQWGNGRKKFSFAEIDHGGSGFCSMLNESSPVAGGVSLKFTSKGVLVKARKCIDATFSGRSLVVSEDNVSKSGGPCRDAGLRVQCSTVEVNLSNFKCMDGEFNFGKSPISVIQGPNVSSSSDTSTGNYHTISCHPYAGFDENLVQDGDLFEEEPSNVEVCRRSSFSAEEITRRETYMEPSPSCSESENMQLETWRMNEEMLNLRPVGGSKVTSSRMDSSCKRSKAAHTLISNSPSEIQTENPESFAALHILVDTAVWVLENGLPGCKGEDEAKDSTGRWAIFHATGVPFWQKRVIRKAKSAFKSNLMVADSELLLSNKLGSPESSETNENQFMDSDVADKDHGAIQSVRS